MAARCRYLFLLVCLLATASRLVAAPATEEGAFQAAWKEFQDGLYKQAESDFGDFTRIFPDSQRLPEAFFFQAEARVKLGDYSGALALLSAHQGQAGKLADEYLFWQGQAAFQKGDYRAAADTFARLAHDFPASSRSLESVIRGATALTKLSDWPRVIALFEQTNGVFQAAALASATNDLVARGFIMLAEAHLSNGAPDKSEAALQRLSKARLNPELDWQRQYLRCRLFLFKDQTEAALQNTAHLLTAADASGQRVLQAESAAFQAGILERLGRIDDAITSYQKNLADGIPQARQRESLLKVTNLLLARDRLSEAAQVLDKFLAQYPNAEAADLALLTLGELRLRQHEAGSNTNLTANPSSNPPAVTNYLQQASDALQTLATKFPQSPFFGKGQLDLGWCFWLEGNFPKSEAAFQAAVERLPLSIEQADAYFKLADAQFRQTNFTAALANYSAVLEKFKDLPQVRTNLFEPALYQLVRVALAANDLTAATNALAKILANYPNGFHADRAVLLTGQKIGESNPEAARNLFLDFAAHAPAAALLPEVRLAIARTYEQQDKWPEAIDQYNTWLAAYTNHPGFSHALYYCALANFRDCRTTNALALFTTFVERFPNDELAPLAQLSAADYLFRMGRFEEAESKYQLCFRNTNCPPLLGYHAQMMAGRAALARLVWKDATRYFTNLTSDLKCPPDIWGQAMFAYGDTLMSQDSTNRTADLQTAIAVFTAICDKFPNQPQAALAWGEKAKCLLQLAVTASDYDPVTNAFQQVLNSPAADAAARGIAQIGLGLVLEKIAEQKPETEQTALYEAALEHYLVVFYYEKLLRSGERPDPFWTRKAGFEAARLLGEKLKRRVEAINILRRLQQMFPPLHLEDRINALQSQQPDGSQRS